MATTNKNRTVGLVLTTSNQDIYTVPTSFRSTVESVVISNTSSLPVTFSLDWYQVLSTTYYAIATNVRMEPNSVLQLTNAFYLAPRDKIRGLASAGSSITVSIRVSEDFVTVNP
jgi:hypothetical protein